MRARALGPDQRREDLARMRDREFDLLVVGGGVTGTGIALDAATRGLTVALVEQRDFAAGTSSRSSKLIHGGLRYLEKLDFGLVREALRERGLMLRRLAPHLVKPVPFLFPLSVPVWDRAYVGTGVLLYDTIGGAGAVPRHRHLSKSRVTQMVPSIRREGLTGAIRYYDAQVDDARHTMMLARTAASYGAAVATSARVEALTRNDEGDVDGVTVHDLESGERFDVLARQVVIAAGVWTDELTDMVGAAAPFRVRMSKGIHVTVPRDRIRSTVGLITRTEKSVLFVIPWKDLWIIGTTDTEWELDRAHPTATEADIDYVLEHANEILDAALTRDDVTGVFAGLRPLLAQGDEGSTADLSREHALAEIVPNVRATAGGKYTTYRVMAAEAVDAVVGALGRTTPCVTDEIPLLGAGGYRGLWSARERLAREHGLAVTDVEHLLDRFGDLVLELFALIDERPELAERLPGADDYLAVEAVYAASHEGALHLEDVLARRTRIEYETAHRGLETAEAVAGLIAPILGWDDDTRERELRQWREHVEAAQEAERLADDGAANAVVVGAPEGRAALQP